MLTVSDDLVRVDSELGAGRLRCPGCGGLLRGWGWARVRTIREGVSADRARVRPRRARCAVCGATHVLLGVSLAARRADAAGVIAAAIGAKAAEGRGHRSIAEWIGRPVATVRGWLRSFAASAVEITQAFGQLLTRDAGDAGRVWPAPAASASGQAVAAVIAYARMLAAGLGIGMLPWPQVGLSVAGPWLFSRCWSERVGQHQLTLMPRLPAPGG